LLSNSLSSANKNGTNPKNTVILGKLSYHERANSRPLRIPRNIGRLKNFNIQQNLYFMNLAKILKFAFMQNSRKDKLFAYREVIDK